MRQQSRREFGALMLAGLPAALMLPTRSVLARAGIDSRVKGIQIGAITYSLNTIAANPDDIIKAFVTVGLGEMELMSNHCEALAGRTAGRGASAIEWRRAATEATFAPVRKKIEDAGITVALLCYNMNVNSTTDEDIEYAFTMARGLGARAISTSTQVSMAKRIAPVAERHKIMVGFHGHDSTANPDEVHNEASFNTIMAAGRYIGANLDIGHYMVAGGDPVAFIRKYPDRITNLHLKDKKKDGTNVAWGQGDTPIKDVLQLLVKDKIDLPTNIEYVHADPDGAVAGVGKCFQFIKSALA